MSTLAPTRASKDIICHNLTYTNAIWGILISYHFCPGTRTKLKALRYTPSQHPCKTARQRDRK